MSQKAEEIVQDVKAGTERIRVVKDLIRTLTKSAKAFKLYNEKHHLVTKFLEEMEQSIENSLKVCGIVILEVTDTSLLLGDDPVYEQKSQEGNYAFRLYKDGIRRLIFRKKPHQKELRSFLDILGRTPMMLAQSQDDMVTLLWKADLESIGYKAIDGFAEMMMGDEEFKDDYRGTLCEILPGFADMLSEQEEGWGTEMRRSEAPQEKLDVGHPEAIYAKSLELLRTSPDHKSQQRLHERMSEEGAEDLLFRHMATVLLRCMLTPGFPFGSRERIVGFVNLLVAMVHAQAFPSYLASVTTLEVLVRQPQLLPGELPVVLKRVLREVASGERLLQLLPQLQQLDDKVLVAIGQFFLRNGVVPLQRLQELANEELPWGGRILVRSLLQGSGRDELDTWLGWLSGNDEERALEAVDRIAGQIEVDRSIPVLRRALRHPLPQVRLEAGKMLLQLNAESFGEMVLKLLEDPEHSVRKGMIPLLERFSLDQLGEPLLQCVRSREFRQLDEAERNSWIGALARPGEDRFLGALEQLLEFSTQSRLKKLFSRKALSLDPTRQAVLDALFTIGTPAARRIVERVRQEGDASIRNYCQAFELQQRHKQLQKDRPESLEKKEEQRAATQPGSEPQLRLTPVPEPSPAVFKDLLIPLGELIPLAPEQALYAGLEQVPDRLADEQELDDGLSALSRRSLLEGLRPGTELKEVHLDTDPAPASADIWTLEPQSVLLTLAPRGMVFSTTEAVEPKRAPSPLPQAAAWAATGAPLAGEPARTKPALLQEGTPPVRGAETAAAQAPTGRLVPAEARVHTAPAGGGFVTPLPGPVIEEARSVSPVRAVVPEPLPLPEASAPPAERVKEDLTTLVLTEVEPEESIALPAPVRAPMSAARAAAIETLLRKYLRALEERKQMPGPQTAASGPERTSVPVAPPAAPAAPAAPPPPAQRGAGQGRRSLRQLLARSQPPPAQPETLLLDEAGKGGEGGEDELGWRSFTSPDVGRDS